MTDKEVSAAMTWPAKCASFGKLKPNQNPKPQHLNCLLTNAAIQAKIPPEVVKAVATKESDWRQFKNGHPFISSDKGIGIMQITDQEDYNTDKLKTDIYYNIQAGVEILNRMYQRTAVKKPDLPKIKGAGPEIIENWYFPVMAYNGTKPLNSPLYKSTGKKNTKAYQEKVFTLIQKDSFLNHTKLGQFPFRKTDFKYDPNSDKNIVFNKLEYTITNQMHSSTHLFHKGKKVAVTMDGATVRSKPSSKSSNLKKLAKGTTLIIDGDFVFDLSLDSDNKFVWYRVKTTNQKLKGYISSAYIIKYFSSPKVNKVTNMALAVTGKTDKYASVTIKIGTRKYTAKANDSGNFKVKIPKQRAGKKLYVYAKDTKGNVSATRTVTVLK